MSDGSHPVALPTFYQVEPCGVELMGWVRVRPVLHGQDFRRTRQGRAGQVGSEFDCSNSASRTTTPGRRIRIG